MNNLLIAGLAGVLVIAGGAGYAAVTFEKPSFGVIDMGDWKEVNEDSITVVSEAWINNPNSIGLSIGFIDVRYAAEVNNITLAEGEIDKVSLNSGNNTQEFETELKQGKIPEWWISHVENGENSTVSVPVNIGTPVNSLEIQVFSKEVSTDITSRIENSLESIEGTYTGPGIETTRSGFTVELRPEVEVRDFKASWGDISEDRSEILMDMEVHNPNQYPVPTPSFGGKADLNNITVANWTANSEPLTELSEEGMIAPGETEELRFRVGLKNQEMDDWLETHVENEEFTHADINADLIFNIQGQEFKAPAGGMKCTIEIQTDILVDDKKQNFDNKGCEPRKEDYTNSGESTGSETENSSDENQIDEQDLIDEGLLG